MNESIRLSPHQVAMAETIGALREREDAEVPDRHFTVEGGTERQHQHAAGAEIAVCRFIGGWWAATDHVGGRANAGADARLGLMAMQVRWTRHADGHLLLRPENDRDAVFVLVTGELPYFAIRGAIRAGVGMRDDYWRADIAPAHWWVPQRALWPFRVRERAVPVLEVA